MSEDSKHLTIGAPVTVAGMRGVGEVLSESDRKGQVLVAIGSLKVKVDREKVKLLEGKRHAKAGKGKKAKSKAAGEPALSGEVTIDLHGMTVDEALERVERELDRALTSHKARLRIVHGKGSGKLKAAVRRYLETSRHVSHVRFDGGNSGVTIAEL